MDKDADELAASLLFRIVRQIQYGERNPMWELVLDDGSIIDAGGTKSLLGMHARSRLRYSLFDKALVPSDKARREWRNHAGSFLIHVEREHRPRSEYRRKYGR